MREKCLIQEAEGIGGGSGGGGFQMGRISMGRMHVSEKTMTDGENSMGGCAEEEKKRPCLGKGRHPIWLEEKVLKAQQ